MSTDQVRMEPPEAAAAPNRPGESTTAGGSRTTGTTSAKGAEPNLAAELREFGKQIETLFRTARSSTRGQEIEQQLTSAWRDVERGINTTISSAQAGDIKGTVTGTAQYAADEAQASLARGLRGLNQWMAQKTQEADARRKARQAAESKATSTAPSSAAGATGNRAAEGAADNEVADRFGQDEPVFGEGEQIPSTPLRQTPSGNTAANSDDLVNDRFNNQGITFGGSKAE